MHPTARVVAGIAVIQAWKWQKVRSRLPYAVSFSGKGKSGAGLVTTAEGGATSQI